MNVRPHEVVQLVEDAVDHLDQQVALLVLQCRRHQQRQDLVEEGVGAELTCLVCDLTKCRLTDRRNAPKLETWRSQLKSASVGFGFCCKLVGLACRFATRSQLVLLNSYIYQCLYIIKTKLDDISRSHSAFNIIQISRNS